MASYRQRSLVPLWLVLVVAAVLLASMHAADTGQLVLDSVQDFAISAGALAALCINAILGGTAIASGRTAAWWPTLASFVGLAAWLYMTLQMR
jgi:hypothetical protein